MLKKFLLFAAVILLLSSGAFADIGQVQGFSIGALNKAERVGGYGWAKSGNMLTVGHSQKTYGACCGSAARQQEKGKLLQHARTAGVGGSTAVRQNASVVGLQGQLIRGGRRGLQAQGQCLTLNLNTRAQKAGGIGGAIGSQSFVGEQSQRQVYRGGFSVSSQFVQAEQCTKIIGGKRSDIVVKNNLDVKMFQGNIAK